MYTRSVRNATNVGEMGREYKLAIRCLEKSREEISKVRNQLTSESQDMVANALREASNSERFNEKHTI
jgi:septal ring factor EnvC (AmiA/AmiB activator)